MGLLLVLVRIELVRQNWTNSAMVAWTIMPCLECLGDDLGDCDTIANTGTPTRRPALNVTGLLMQSAEDRTAQNASRCLGDTRYRLVQ